MKFCTTNLKRWKFLIVIFLRDWKESGHGKKVALKQISFHIISLEWKERMNFFFGSLVVFCKKKTSRVFDSPRRETLETSENINRVERHRKNLEIGKE